MVMKRRIGFIGLGIMGKPMAKNLLAAGYPLVVYDINRKPVDDLVAMGAGFADSPKDVAAQVDVVITMLPNSNHVKEVVTGENGVLAGAHKGQTIIDMSSIEPLVSRELAEIALQHGVQMLDAPVSGGEPKAIDGTLAIMVGGPQAVFDEVKDLLSNLGASIVRIGDAGSGNTAKLVNQIIVALNIAALSEAMVFARKAGVDPEIVYHAIRGGLAGSTVLDAKMPMILKGNFHPGFRIELHVKDLVNALTTAHHVGAPVPLTAQVCEYMQMLTAEGFGKNDHSGLIQFYEKLAGAVVRSGEAGGAPLEP